MGNILVKAPKLKIIRPEVADVYFAIEKNEGGKTTFQKVENAKMYDTLYIVAETKHLKEGFVINVRLHQYLKNYNSSNPFVIQQDKKDTEIIKMEVGNYKDKGGTTTQAIAKIDLFSADKKTQERYNKHLIDSADKKIQIFMEVDADGDGEMKCAVCYNLKKYYGNFEDDPNFWHRGEGEWFEVEERKCFCDRDFTVEELRDIIINLRKKEGLGRIQILRDKSNTKNFAMGEPLKDKKGNIIKKELSFYEDISPDGNINGERLFHLNSKENIIKEEKNYTNLAKWLNYIFEKIDATKCIHKIHILAQIYHETQRLGSSYETDGSAKISGEDFYRGRGLIMLTKKYNYINLYKHLYLNTPTDKDLEYFCPKIAKKLEMASKSAVWYLNNVNVKEYFEFSDEKGVEKVSAKINRPKSITDGRYDKINGMNERKKFFNLLKDIMPYGDCKNCKNN
ncbi:hypothetical protein ACIRNY_02880 [Capnocytophaga canimorsus]